MAELAMQHLEDPVAEEAALVERAKSDEQAFELLYHRYFNKVYGYIFKRTGQHEITEDILSATFLKVFTHLGKYQHQGFPFSAWVFRIATNELIDHYRKSGRQGPKVNIEDAPEPIDPQQSPEMIMEQQLTKEQIQGLILKLNPRDQEIINLKFFAELSNPEIATILNISTNNAGVMIHRAVKRFHDVYKQYGH
jgi:RNA polymerase sigma-70 factor (ECF subfamily)